MKTFKRFRTLEELKPILKSKKWKLNTDKFKAGSDFVSVDFKIKTLATPVSGTALYDPALGRLFGITDSGKEFNAANSDCDHLRWFNILLAIFLTNS